MANSIVHFRVKSRSNPRSRARVIARAGVPAKKYLSRPSQLSRTTPTKRLRMRRSVNLDAGREGFFPNPKTVDLTRPPRDDRDLPSTDHAVYQHRERRPKWNVKVSPLMDPREGGAMLRRRLPHFTKADHASAARYFENERTRSLGAWNALIEREHLRVFGRPYQVTDYKISGIGRDEYSEKAKDTLRGLAHYASEAGAAAAAHYRAAGHRSNRAPETVKQNPTRKARSLISLTGQHSGKVYGFAEEKDLAPDKRGTLRRRAQVFANQFHEPIRFERVSVTTLSPRMRENPAPRTEQIAAAQRRFTRFTGHKAENVRQFPFPENPGAALAVGPVLMLGYSAMRDGKTENYLHKFTRHAAPTLAASHDGNTLYLLGGRYRFTERGIVDTKNR